MIEKAMRDVHFSAHPTRSAKQQVGEPRSNNRSWEYSRQLVAFCFFLCWASAGGLRAPDVRSHRVTPKLVGS